MKRQQNGDICLLMEGREFVLEVSSFVYGLDLALLFVLWFAAMVILTSTAGSGLCAHGGRICRSEDLAEISDCQNAARSGARKARVGTTDYDYCPLSGRWM
jgi:hypothetical protein